MFERFTERARRVLVLATVEARSLGHGDITAEHLLLGLAHPESGVTSAILEESGVTLEAARALVAETAPARDPAPAGHIPFTAGMKHVLEVSLREALRLNHEAIGPEHLLLGLTRGPQGAEAKAVIQRLGGTLATIRERATEAAVAAAGERPAAGEARVREAQAAPWPPSGLGRALRTQSQAVTELRELLAAVDQRLARIERHLGLPADSGPTNAPGEAGEPSEPGRGKPGPSGEPEAPPAIGDGE
jgi:ATP-dependent Clp protease ATP-binding subunit ClpC